MADLRLLQLNIEYGGTGVDFDKVVEAIATSGAPVAALQEGCGSMPRIASALGWPYVDNRTQVVSQLPLLNPPATADGVVFVELEPGHVVAVVNVHPPSRGFGPFRAGGGEPEARTVRRERRVRLSALQPSLDAARALMRRGVPVVLLGDFNAPSHRDWTDRTVGQRPHMLRPIAWPTSVAAEDTGLVDAYRAVYPDPVAHPGLTWPARRPFVRGYNPAADGQAEDRIDLMYVSPQVKVLDVQIMGEEESEYSDLSVTPWPTDHRGLLASLQVQPVVPPDLVSVMPRLVPVGAEVQVRVFGARVASVEVLPRDAAAGASGHALVMREPSRWGLETSDIGAGRFDVVARDAEGSEVTRASLWVAGPDDRPQVRTEPAGYGVGEPIGVQWSWTPGNRADWIALYHRGEPVGDHRPALHLPTHATIDGSATFSEASHPRRWPLPPGDYTAHLLMDDLKISLAASDLTVHQP